MYSVANVVTVLRLLVTPVFFTVLVMRGGRYGIVAFALFVGAAATDFLDGLIARRTGHVTEIGKVIDPLVDRLLIAFGVLGLYLLDRLPLWIVAVLIARDGYLLYGAWVLERHHRRMPVLYIGKVTTAVLLTAFAALILGPDARAAGGRHAARHRHGAGLRGSRAVADDGGVVHGAGATPGRGSEGGGRVTGRGRPSKL